MFTLTPFALTPFRTSRLRQIHSRSEIPLRDLFGLWSDEKAIAQRMAKGWGARMGDLTRENGGFWTPKTSFPANGDSGPCLGSGESQFRTRRIGADPEKSDLVNFRGPDWRKFSELCVLLFFPRRNWQNVPKSRFSKPIFGHSTGSTNICTFRPVCCLPFAKNLAPYRIGKRPHKRNRAKIHQKYRKSYFFAFLVYFFPILRVAVFS